MVLEVEFSTKDYLGRREELVLHVGNKVNWSELHLKGLRQENVLYIYADGHELDWIRKNFVNLPCSNFRSTTWFGDIAKTIAAGLYFLDK